MLLLFVPLSVLIAGLFSYFWPVSHAVQHSLYAFTVGLIGLQILLFTFRDFPFSRKLEKGAASKQLVIVFVTLGLMGAFVALPCLIATSLLLFLSTTAFLVGVSLVLGHLNNRRYARRTVET